MLLSQVAFSLEPLNIKKELNRKVDLSLWNKGLDSAVSQISGKSRLRLVTSRDITGGKLSSRKIFLQANDVTIKQALDLLAKALCCRYRIKSDGMVYFSSSYDWVGKRSPEPIIENVESFLDDDYEIDAFERTLSELTKPITLFNESFFARLEVQGQQVKLVASVPAGFKSLLLKVLELMASSGQTIKRSRTLIPSEDRELFLRLSKPILATYRNTTLEEVLADMSLQSRINFCVDDAYARVNFNKKISLDLGTVKLMNAVEALQKELGLKGVEIYPPNVIWLGAKANNWSKISSYEALWGDNAVVASYDVSGFPPQLSGEALAYQIRSRISPDAWLDPLASIVYFQPQDSLIVIASAAIQNKVYKALSSFKFKKHTGDK